MAKTTAIDRVKRMFFDVVGGGWILAGTVMNEEGLSHFIRQIGYI